MTKLIMLLVFTARKNFPKKNETSLLFMVDSIRKKCTSINYNVSSTYKHNDQGYKTNFQVKLETLTVINNVEDQNKGKYRKE